MALEQARLVQAAVALSALLLSACSTSSSPPATTAQTPYLRQTLNSKWLQWPPNDGFSAGPISETLAAGTLIDRFGSENGRFFSPQGESYAARALPYVCSTLVYRVYRVTRPIQVTAGKAAPWFDEPGGATQYETDEPASRLRESGSLEPVSGETKMPCGGAE